MVAGPAAAQFGRGGPGMRPPQVRGVLNPVVGSGAVYQTANGEVEISLVGKEDVGGKPGYWVQIGVGQMYMKNLTVVDGKNMTVSRMIMQPPGGGPMEMSPAMFGAPPGADVREGQLVGTESVTTPAGTFNCEHYRANNGSWEAWIAPNVPPWGLVKSKSESGEMTLLRTITGVKDRITGTPQKFELPPGFGGIPEGVIPGR